MEQWFHIYKYMPPIHFLCRSQLSNYKAKSARKEKKNIQWDIHTELFTGIKRKCLLIIKRKCTMQLHKNQTHPPSLPLFFLTLPLVPSLHPTPAKVQSCLTQRSVYKSRVHIKATFVPFIVNLFFITVPSSLECSESKQRGRLVKYLDRTSTQVWFSWGTQQNGKGSTRTSSYVRFDVWPFAWVLRNVC